MAPGKRKKKARASQRSDASLRATEQTRREPPRRRRPPPPPPPPLHHAPIDVAEHLRIVMLCSNRTILEQGISRMIVGYYKDLLADDILKRMVEIRDTLKEVTRVTRSNRVLLGELIHYMNFYKNNTQFLSKAWVVHSNIALWSDCLRQPIAESTFDTLLSLYELHSSNNAFVGRLVSFLFVCMAPSPMINLRLDPHLHWKGEACQRILDVGMGEYLLDTLATVITLPRNTQQQTRHEMWLARFIFLFCLDNPQLAGQHVTLLRRLMEAVVAFLEWDREG